MTSLLPPWFLARGAWLRALHAALVLSVSAHGAATAEPASHGDPVPQNSAPRLLHLREGGVLRAKARMVEGGWEVQRAGGWIRLPATAVERAALERDVLEEARLRERALERDRAPGEPAAGALDARAAHSEWLLDEGLSVEALHALDLLLEHAPEEPRARALCLDERLALELPPLIDRETQSGTERTAQARRGVDLALLEAFLAQAARGGPVLREQAAAALHAALEPTAPDLAEALCAELAHPDARRRTLSAFLLRRALPGRGLEPLLSRSIHDGSRAVRLEANRALSAADDARVLGTLVRLLSARDAQVRTRALEALADSGHGAAVQPLIAFLASLDERRSAGPGQGSVSFGTWTAFVGDFDVEVAQGAAIANPRPSVVGSGASLEATVLSTSQITPARESTLARDALERLTLARPGRTSRAWLQWWTENGDEWTRAHPAPPDRSAPSSSGGG